MSLFVDYMIFIYKKISKSPTKKKTVVSNQ